MKHFTLLVPFQSSYKYVFTTEDMPDIRLVFGERHVNNNFYYS